MVSEDSLSTTMKATKGAFAPRSLREWPNTMAPATLSVPYSSTGRYIGRTWKVGIVHEQLWYGQLTMEIVMRGNCTEAVWMEGLTVAKTAAPMGAIMAGRRRRRKRKRKGYTRIDGWWCGRGRVVVD